MIFTRKISHCVVSVPTLDRDKPSSSLLNSSDLCFQTRQYMIGFALPLSLFPIENEPIFEPWARCHTSPICSHKYAINNANVPESSKPLRVFIGPAKPRIVFSFAAVPPLPARHRCWQRPKYLSKKSQISPSHGRLLKVKAEELQGGGKCQNHREALESTGLLTVIYTHTFKDAIPPQEAPNWGVGVQCRRYREQ